MDWIEKDIAIGNHLEAEDGELLKKESVVSALSLDGILSGVQPASLNLKRIEVVRLGSREIDLRKSEAPVLYSPAWILQALKAW